MNEIDGLMRRAVARHRAGDLTAAAALYGDVLARRPDLADAHHLLGLVEHQRGNSRWPASMTGPARSAAPSAIMSPATR